MTSPFQRIGQALRQSLQAVRQQFGRAPGRVHTEHVRVNPRSEQTRPAYRVGVGYKQKGTNIAPAGEPEQRVVTGNLPTKAGVAEALARVPDGRVEVTVYGRPSWNTQRRKSPKPDKFENVHWSFFAPKSELQSALVGPGSLEDWVYDQSTENFHQVLAVTVSEG